MHLHIEVDDDEIRHDIKSLDVQQNYPFLPRRDATWLNSYEYSKKRMRYLHLKDNFAYQKLLKEHKIDFKPSKLINLSPSDRIFIMFEDYILFKKSPPPSMTTLHK